MKLVAPYHRSVIEYVIAGKPQKINYLNGLEMTADLVAIIIFSRHFPGSYNKARSDAEDRLARDKEVRFRNVRIHSVRWKTGKTIYLTMDQFKKFTKNQ